MKINYRILSFNIDDNSILVRYWTDLLTERQLSVDPLEVYDTPDHCRSDCNITLPFKATSSEHDVHRIIMHNVPRQFLQILEQPHVLDAQMVNAIVGTPFAVNLTEELL